MTALPPYRGLQPFFGDIHNHCAISYGHGSLESAFANAKLQLDFASVTGHAHWPDMPVADERLAPVVAYHRDGFERLAGMWDRVQDVTEDLNEDGSFVTFLSFEWHSLAFGDHCVYFNGSRGEIVRADDLAGLRRELRAVREAGGDALALPHHICYRAGRRGINWDHFTDEFSPVVEMMSMHGCSESHDAPRPYLHTMGPRDAGSTMQEGLRRGNVFGVIGSSDHHSAHPGSHGHGRMGVWATSLTRQAVWEALRSRRTYALTGDRIELAFEINGTTMGGIVDATPHRSLSVAVAAGDALDYVEVVRNGAVVHRWDALDLQRFAAEDSPPLFRARLGISLGWGQKDETTEWDVELWVEDGEILRREPRFRGEDVVAPQSETEDVLYHFSSWEPRGARGVALRTRTRGNPTTTTDATQAFALEILGTDATRVVTIVNGRRDVVTVGELREGPRSGYLGGFLTAAYQLHRAVLSNEYELSATMVDERPVDGRDVYYVRVRQRNDQWAWSSPIWVGHP